jgi:hypothetical protein
MNATFFCPYPLVGYDPSIFIDGATIIEAGPNCAIPCPSVDFTSDEWNFWVSMLSFFVIVSCITSTLSFVSHMLEFQRFFILNMFIGGFMSNSFVQLLFLILNTNNDVVCAGEGSYAYIERGQMCKFQSAATIFLFIWTESWSVFLALDTYLHITSGTLYIYLFVSIYLTILLSI